MKEYPPWFIEMMQDMLDMRDAQKEYFKQPNDYKLRVSKSKEQKVDQHIEHFVKQSIIFHREKPKDTQASLFS